MLTLKDVADFQETDETHLITYKYTPNGPSNQTTWTAECKSERFFFWISKISVEIIFQFREKSKGLALRLRKMKQSKLRPEKPWT